MSVHHSVTVPVALAVGYALRRVYRRLVAVPRHRLPLAQRVRRSGRLHVIPPPHGRHPAHRMVATTEVPEPRKPVEAISPLPRVAPEAEAVPEPGAVTEPDAVAEPGAAAAPRRR